MGSDILTEYLAESLAEYLVQFGKWSLLEFAGSLRKVIRQQKVQETAKRTREFVEIEAGALANFSQSPAKASV